MERSKKLPDFVAKKKLFDKQFTELYLAGYSATRMVEIMGVKIKYKVRHKDEFLQRQAHQANCQAWFFRNRKRLGLTRTRPDFKNNPDLSHRTAYIERNRIRRLQRLPLKIAKLQKRKNELIDRLLKLNAELEKLKNN